MTAILRKRATATTGQTATAHSFIFSNGQRDRYGDKINVHGWNLTEFNRNPIALLNHDPDRIIGTWTRVRTEGDALKGSLVLAPLGTSQHADEARKLIDAGILRACSVGFIPEEFKNRHDGVDYIRQKLIEVSVVSIPAHSEAMIEEAASLGVSRSIINELFCKPPVDASLAQRQEHAAAALDRRRAESRAATAKARGLIARIDAMRAAWAREDYFKTSAGQYELEEEHARRVFSPRVRDWSIDLEELQRQGVDPVDAVRHQLAQSSLDWHEERAYQEALAVDRAFRELDSK